MKNNKTRTLCEAAIFIAMAEILSFIKLYEFPNGGSVTLEMLPIICSPFGMAAAGARRGFVFGHRDLSHRQQVLHRLDHHHLRLLPGLHGAGLWRRPAGPPEVERVLWHRHRRRAAVFGPLHHGAVVWGKVYADESSA